MRVRIAYAALVCVTSFGVVELASSAASAQAQPAGKVVKVAKAGAPPKAIAVSGPGCAASGWVQDNSNTNHQTVVPNPVGTSPSSFTLYFSPGGDPSGTLYPVTWSWASGNSGNPVTVEMTANRFTLNIFNQTPLHGVWSANNTTWTTFTAGYWAVVACK